jgi:hypothetical protein
MPLLLFIAACAGMVIVPFLFESYTFYRYTIGEPDFFIFSGARLWFFLASELILGFAAGRASKLPSIAAAGCIAAAIVVLVSLLYQVCDPQQCYYSGPDGASWLRLGVLLFAATTTGMLTGWKSKKGMETRSSASAVLFGATAAIFLGYYPVALLFGTFLTYQMALALLAFASSAPFFFAGIASSTFSDRARHCPQMAAVDGGNSHWKVLWKWGAPNDNARVEVRGTGVTVGLG